MAIINATRFPVDTVDYFTVALPAWTAGQTIMLYLGCNGVSSSVPMALALWSSAYSIRLRLFATFIYVECEGEDIGTMNVPTGRASSIGVAITFDGTTARSYIWEAPTPPTAQAGSHSYAIAGGGDLYVGADRWGDLGWVESGQWLEYLYVDNEAWSLAEVQAQAAQKVPIKSVTGFWRLEGGSGVADIGTDLTVHGTPVAASSGVDLPETLGVSGDVAEADSVHVDAISASVYDVIQSDIAETASAHVDASLAVVMAIIQSDITETDSVHVDAIWCKGIGVTQTVGTSSVIGAAVSSSSSRQSLTTYSRSGVS